MRLDKPVALTAARLDVCKIGSMFFSSFSVSKRNRIAGYQGFRFKNSERASRVAAALCRSMAAFGPRTCTPLTRLAASTSLPCRRHTWHRRGPAGCPGVPAFPPAAPTRPHGEPTPADDPEHNKPSERIVLPALRRTARAVPASFNMRSSLCPGLARANPARLLKHLRIQAPQKLAAGQISGWETWPPARYRVGNLAAGQASGFGVWALRAGHRPGLMLPSSSLRARIEAQGPDRQDIEFRCDLLEGEHGQPEIVAAKIGLDMPRRSTAVTMTGGGASGSTTSRICSIWPSKALA